MKKQRQISRQGPIQLSANKKSHSINLKSKQEQLFAPYKIDWKNPSNDNVLFGANPSLPLKQPFKNIENSATSSPFGSNLNSNTNSKLFYKSMKNQLLNIKQDVQKLILKERKISVASVEQMITANDQHPLTDYQNNNGCIKTINIKNKCQQKASKVENGYESVDKVLASKISDNGSVSSKFTIGGESRHDHPVMNNFIEQSIKNTSNLESKYRSEKDANYMRAKSKSIAESFSKGFALDLLNSRQESRQNNKISIASSLKFLQNDDSQNQQEQFIERSEHIKPKMEVEIKLPSFEKAKNDQVNVQEEKVHEEKNKLIEKLQSELNDLEKELSLRDELMSRKQQSKFQLTEEIQKLKKQLQAEKQSNQEKSIKYEEEINNLKHLNQQNQNRARFYEQELQKAIYVIRQKEQQVFNLIETSNNQANAIQELNTACQKLTVQIREMKQSVDQSKSIKEKMKLKENQVYIYQEELKEAKSKIKELKESLSGYIPSKSSDSEPKKVQESQKTLEESSKLNWELKECRRLNESFKAQNQRLKKEIHSINTMNSQNQSKIAQLLKQNSQLTTKINQFEKDSQNAIQELINSADFQGVGNEISKKLSQMVDENYQLKNKISRLESCLQEMTFKNSSINEQLQIYREKSDLMKDCTRRLKIEDWDNLTEERDLLKSELEAVKDRLEQTKEFYELETMRKQNEIHELRKKIEDMIETDGQNEQSFHPNVRSVKHIKNLDVLLSEFKEMIEYNLELKDEIDSLRR